MGNFKLSEPAGGSIGNDNVLHAFGRFVSRSMDDLISNKKQVIEGKIALYLLTLIGIPAGVYAYFLQVNTNFDLVKGIILLSIGAFTGLVLAARLVIKFLTDIQEYRRKYYRKRPNKGSSL